MNGVHCQTAIVMMPTLGNSAKISTRGSPISVVKPADETEHRIEQQILPDDRVDGRHNEKRRDR